jgi:hypothetical protein
MKAVALQHAFGRACERKRDVEVAAFKRVDRGVDLSGCTFS